MEHGAPPTASCFRVGTVIKPPAIIEMSTTKSNVEHVMVNWTTTDGKAASVAQIFKREGGAMPVPRSSSDIRRE